MKCVNYYAPLDLRSTQRDVKFFYDSKNSSTPFPKRVLENSHKRPSWLIFPEKNIRRLSIFLFPYLFFIFSKTSILSVFVRRL